MKRNTKDLLELIILGAILFVLIIILGVVGIQTKRQNSTNKSDKDVNESVNVKDEDEYKDEIIEKEETTKNDDNKNNDKVIDNVESNNNNNQNNSDKITDNEEEIKSEQKLISYFTSFSNELDNNKDENDVTFREKAKSTFITIVDFLFYDGTINGYKFSELTISRKLKILKIAAGIDNKIDNYYPNYKDVIKEECNDFKGKIALLYLKTTSAFCDKAGEDACKEARDDFNDMKNSFGFTWEIIKTAAKNGKENITNILSEWYKSIKE